MLEEFGLPEVHLSPKKALLRVAPPLARHATGRSLGEGHRMVVYIRELGEIGERHRLKAR